MATFKVGDRVKFVRHAHYTNPIPLGTTGTVIERLRLTIDDEVSVLVDAAHDGGTRERYAKPWQLAPLTDPKADAFLEKMRKLKPYEEREPVLIEVGDGLYVMKDGHE